MQMPVETVIVWNSASVHSAWSSSDGAVTSPTDDELVLRARRGDHSALNDLIERHYRTCLRLALKILKNQTDAEDEVQNAFWRAFEHFEQYQGDGTFAAWLNRIVVNESIVRYRQHRSRRVCYLDQPLAQFSSAKLELVDLASLPDETLEKQEVSAIVMREVSRMPPFLRDVLTLRDLKQLPSKEVARKLGITVPAVKSRLARARAELRSRLDKHCRRYRHGRLLQDSRPRPTLVVSG